MFKKSLAAVAVLGAFAASSFAADVTFYGKLDAGFKYENTETTYTVGTTDTVEGLTLDSGVQEASRFGIKGTEDLGNGYKVGFVLENGFSGDDGSSVKNSRLFDRQAHMDLYTPYGMFVAGRTGAISQASGPFDMVFARADAFDGGHKDVLGFAQMPKLDNMLGYKSPKFAGFQAGVVYSFKNDKDNAGDEGHSNTDHYMGLGLTYDIGALQTAVSFEQNQRARVASEKKVDTKIVTFGANYDFEMFKLFAMGQVFEGMDAMGEYKYSNTKKLKMNGAGDPVLVDWTKAFGEDGVEGYALHVGTTFAALGGDWEAGIYYGDYKADVSENWGTFGNYKQVDGEYFGLAARYAYKLSARTKVMASAGYDELTWDKHADRAATEKDFEKTRYFGRVSLVHNF